MKRPAILVGALLLILAVVISAVAKQWLGKREAHTGIKIPVRMAHTDDVRLEKTGEAYRFKVYRAGKETESLSPDAFAARVHQDRTGRPWWMPLLNINSGWEIAWVALGLLGQVLFTGRMVVQWIVSEKHQESIVPPVFWWLSLIGASLMLTYFLWRWDPVGILGQLTGWLVYVRNLYFIYRPRQATAPEPAA